MAQFVEHDSQKELRDKFGLNRAGIFAALRTMLRSLRRPTLCTLKSPIDAGLFNVETFLAGVARAADRLILFLDHHDRARGM